MRPAADEDPVAKPGWHPAPQVPRPRSVIPASRSSGGPIQPANGRARGSGEMLARAGTLDRMMVSAASPKTAGIAGAGREGVAASGPELLLVSASASQRSLLQRVLGNQGMTVTAVACLSQGSAVCAVQRFDHAVLDLRLPDRKGLDVVRQIRARYPQARIVVITDADSFATVVLALRAGADTLLPKPVHERELMDALLDRTPALPPVPETPLGVHRTCWEHVMRVYEQCGRNMTHSAERLGMHRRSLQRFLSKRAPPSRAELVVRYK